MPAPSDPRLTLHLTEPRITTEDFGRAVNAFFDLLDEVSREMAGAPRAVRWLITVQAGSARLHATPEILAPRHPVRPAELTRVVTQGVQLVQRRAQRPKHFSDAALRITRDLATVRASLQGPQATVSMSPKAAEHVDRLLGIAVEDYGTVEGRLQTLSERRGPHFAVYDDLTDQAIRCNVERERLDEAWRAFGRRVAVSGLIRYRKNGDPVSIEAEHIIPFPEDRDLPSAEDVCGILRNGDG